MNKNEFINKENWEVLYSYLNKIDESFFDLNKNKDSKQNEKIIGNLMALQEEVGEFTSEIRKMTKMMFNQKKIDSFKIEDLEDEACDILITLILTLKSCNIHNLDKSIQRKIKKNNKRGY